MISPTANINTNSLDFSRCRLEPFQHQREDVAWLIKRPYAFIASEMRTGKTKIVIDAAQFMFEAKMIDKIIIVTPAPVRDVWYDPKLGELAKHLWTDIHSTVIEFHARIRTWVHASDNREPLDWYVTNYEFLRSKKRLAELLYVCGPRTLLVGDESSFIKNHRAQQTKAFLQLRRACGRVILLNGTPIFHSPLDLFSQGNILHPSILECPFITHFQSRYAIMELVRGLGGKPLLNRWNKPVTQVKSWTNLPDLQRRFAPYTVRRLQKECLDLPAKLDPVTLSAVLTTETWNAYKDMRDDLVVWLSDGNVAMSATAAIKTLRLSQITSGFLGGVERARIDVSEHWNDLDLVPDDLPDLISIKEIGREKLDVLLWFIEQRLEVDPNLHLVVWCRWRPELIRIMAVVAAKFPQFETGQIMGTQTKAERLRALSLLHPDTSPIGPVFVGGIEGTGSFGLDMAASHTCVTLSSGYSPGRSAQTLDRVYGPRQTHPIAYFDIVATGPNGQRTIDHTIIAARRAGEDIAQWTAGAWVRALTEE